MSPDDSLDRMNSVIGQSDQLAGQCAQGDCVPKSNDIASIVSQLSPKPTGGEGDGGGEDIDEELKINTNVIAHNIEAMGLEPAHESEGSSFIESSSHGKEQGPLGFEWTSWMITIGVLGIVIWIIVLLISAIIAFLVLHAVAIMAIITTVIVVAYTLKLGFCKRGGHYTSSGQAGMCPHTLKLPGLDISGAAEFDFS